MRKALSDLKTNISNQRNSLPAESEPAMADHPTLTRRPSLARTTVNRVLSNLTSITNRRHSLPVQPNPPAVPGYPLVIRGPSRTRAAVDRVVNICRRIRHPLPLCNTHFLLTPPSNDSPYEFRPGLFVVQSSVKTPTFHDGSAPAQLVIPVDEPHDDLQRMPVYVGEEAKSPRCDRGSCCLSEGRLAGQTYWKCKFCAKRHHCNMCVEALVKDNPDAEGQCIYFRQFHRHK
ncbi:hypothetical protein FPQ18DRAFT_308582 [Pyronema domesticum]|nr:hypothetical protein FPQ18DRAFT_308582 [Pyronema domesticum]